MPTYTPNFKAQVVLETYQPNTTIEEVRQRYGLSKNAISNWRNTFKRNVYKVFEVDSKKLNPNESPEELKRIIADLSVENSILKKISRLMN